MALISVDVSDVKKLARELGRFRTDVVPKAAASGANKLAFDGRRVWVDQISRSMTLRNRFTTGSLRVEKARPHPKVDQIKATLGSLAPYLAAQEEGRPTQLKERRAVPLPAAAGQPNAQKRTRLVRKQYSLSTIQLGPRPRKGNQAQRTAATIHSAMAQGKRVVFLELGRSRGFFRLLGGKRRPRLQRLWTVLGRSPAVPRNPTLERTVTIMIGQATRVYYDELQFFAWRHRVLGY